MNPGHLLITVRQSKCAVWCIWTWRNYPPLCMLWTSLCCAFKGHWAAGCKVLWLFARGFRSILSPLKKILELNNLTVNTGPALERPHCQTACWGGSFRGPHSTSCECLAVLSAIQTSILIAAPNACRRQARKVCIFVEFSFSEIMLYLFVLNVLYRVWPLFLAMQTRTVCDWIPKYPQEVQEERIMDIGSTGGNWSKKSPRLLLLEWTQAQKRPKPRYKVLPEANGTFRCKVS